MGKKGSTGREAAGDGRGRSTRCLDAIGGTPPLWAQRLVRCEVDLRVSAIRFYALRRREPSYQPLLRESLYVLPRKRFHE